MGKHPKTRKTRKEIRSASNALIRKVARQARGALLRLAKR